MFKSVAQAIPTYCMSIYLMPHSLTEELERMMNSFWWGSGGAQENGIKWLSWEKMTTRKEDGGLGFRDLYSFNLLLLGKQGWKFLSSPDALMARVFKAKYYPRRDFLQSELGSNPCHCWRSIWSSRVILNEGYRWQIGDGSTIPILGQPWLRCEGELCIPQVSYPALHDHTVKDLFYPTTRTWNHELVHTLFPPHVARDILYTPVLQVNVGDKQLWRFTSDGAYTVKSGYRIYCDAIANKDHLKMGGDWSSIWRLHAPPKVRSFLWRALRGCLPTRMKLHTHHVNVDGVCLYCARGLENDWHLFFGCSFAEA